LEIRDLVVDFPGSRETVRALDGLTLSVAEGCVYGFLGPNGAGKTTTLHVLLGFVAPTSGRAEVFGCDVRRAIARRRIGYLPEHAESYRFLTGREQLALAGRLFGLRGAELRSRVKELLDLVDLTVAADRRVAAYSRGMLQRLGLAQALVHDPDLVILDEPTSGFDPVGRLAVRRIIAGLRERGKTVFFSSHELSEVELVCDRIGILVRGRLAVDGAVSDLVGHGEHLERYFLSVVNP
jgi:ABC-2 type transport system ATP-binding protein